MNSEKAEVMSEKEKMFEKIYWEEQSGEYLEFFKCLSDDEYIEYTIWVCKKENSTLPNIIFHGGCLDCISQQINGIDKCRGCQYFRANWSLPSLRAVEK